LRVRHGLRPPQDDDGKTRHGEERPRHHAPIPVLAQQQHRRGSAEDRLQQRISELGRELYERLPTLLGHFNTLGKSLDTAVGSYNRAVGSMESRVLVTARKFEELGVAAPEGLPEPPEVDQRARVLHAPEVRALPDGQLSLPSGDPGDGPRSREEPST